MARWDLASNGEPRTGIVWGFVYPSGVVWKLDDITEEEDMLSEFGRNSLVHSGESLHCFSVLKE